MVIVWKDVFGKFRNGLAFIQEFVLAPLHPLPQVLHSKNSHKITVGILKCY
jgi:hypothetical protein